MAKFEAVLLDFEQATARLREVLALQKSDVIRDSAIQRFEFTLDLAWKTVKAFLDDRKGVICASPKDCFREAYRQKIIDYDDAWIKLVDMRNLTAHTYHEDLAEEIYSELPKALEYFEALLKELKK